MIQTLKNALLTLLFLIISPLTFAGEMLSITDQELMQVADKIFMNEASGNPDKLITWNQGENFPSLGIGHFIWYKAGEVERFEETFPGLVTFLEQKGAKLPFILVRHKTAPWPNREHFLTNQNNASATALKEFLYQTRDLQILYIFNRLQAALPKMEAASRSPQKVRDNFYAVANANNGLYALIDYVNFKGEGTNPNERYKGQGWGLLQVLEGMPHLPQNASTALTHFRESSKARLSERVQNADPARNESRWLQGWHNRCETYR